MNDVLGSNVANLQTFDLDKATLTLVTSADRITTVRDTNVFVNQGEYITRGYTYENHVVFLDIDNNLKFSFNGVNITAVKMKLVIDNVDYNGTVSYGSTDFTRINYTLSSSVTDTLPADCDSGSLIIEATINSSKYLLMSEPIDIVDA